MNGRVANARAESSRFTRFLTAIACLVAAASAAQGRTIGMVADDDGDVVVIFDAETRSAFGAVAVGSGLVGDCSINADQSLGFVTDFNYQLWVIDLRATPPRLAQPHPILLSNPGEDTALSPDGRYLLVCDGLANVPISVVDVEARAEVGTFSLGSNCSAVDFCADGSVLAASSSTGRVHRLALDDSGTLTATGEVLSTGWIGSRGPNNVHCSPGGTAGVVVRRGFPDVTSFRVPGLEPVDSLRLPDPGFAVAAAFTPDGVIVRNDGGSLYAFDFDETTAAMGDTARLQVPVGPAVPFLGIDPLAIEPSSGELWVTEPGALDVRDAATGEKLDTLQGVSLSQPTGVCFAAGAPAPGNAPPDCAAARASTENLWPPRGHMEEVNVGGVTDPDGDPVGVVVTGVYQDEASSGRGRDQCADAYVASADTVSLRARREGGGDGRVYHVSFEADDGRGGSCTGAVRVCVPSEPGVACGDQGPVVDALKAACPAGKARAAQKAKK